MIHRPNPFAWLSGIFLVVIGLLAMQYVSKPLSEAFSESEKWPQTEGVITDGEVLSFRSDGQNMYRASLVYKYEVDGKQYHSNAIRKGISSTSFKYFPKRKVEKHPIGSKVMVFYNPALPSEALLEPGLGALKYLFYGIPASFILIGLMVFWKRALKPLAAVLILSNTKL